MKKFEEYKFDKMKVSEVKEFFHNFNDAIQGCEYINTNLAAQVALWKKAYDKLNWAYDTALKADESDEIHDLDFQTDNWITAIKAGANGASKSYDEEMRAAGETLKQAFVSFPVKLNDNYIAELGQVDSLIAALKGEDMVACITKIGMLPLFNLLVAANDRMHELIADRDVDNINRPNRPEARREAIRAYLNFTDYINSYRMVIPASTEDEGFNRFVALVNSIIERFERVILNNRPGSKPEDGPNEGDGGNEGNTDGGDDENEDNDENEGGEENNPQNPNPDNPNPENPNPENPNPGTGGSTGGGSTLQPDPDDDDEIPEGDDPWRTGK